MAKKAKTAKAKRDKTAKAKPKPRAKMTAEQLSDQQRQTLLFQHKRKIAPLITAKSTATSNLTKAFELAKKEGITKKEIELAIRLDTDEGAEKVKAEVERTMRVARWVGSKIGMQLDLFPKQPAAVTNFEDGKRAALDDQPARPPGHLSQTATQQWLEGHAAGRAQLNETRLSSFKPIGEAVSDLVPPAPPVPPEVTEAQPPSVTH